MHCSDTPPSTYRASHARIHPNAAPTPGRNSPARHSTNPPVNKIDTAHRQSGLTISAASDTVPKCTAVSGSENTIDASEQQNAESTARSSHPMCLCRPRNCPNRFPTGNDR